MRASGQPSPDSQYRGESHVGRFEGKSVIVTGGAAASAARRASPSPPKAAGCWSPTSTSGRGADGGVGSRGRRRGGLPQAVDVSRDEDCRQMVATVVARFGSLDVAFNNAGIGGTGFPLHEEEEVTFDRMIAINLKGVFLCMRHEIAAMLKSGGGAIVNTSSVAGLVGNPGLSSYCAAKHGVTGMTRAAALDYIGKGIPHQCDLSGRDADPPARGRARPFGPLQGSQPGR